MKKSKKQPVSGQPNLVAKHAHHFNKAFVFKDKTKFNRKAKHKNTEPFPIVVC